MARDVLSVLKANECDHPRVQAKKIDKLLGYKIPKIEVKLLQKYRAYDQPIDETSRKQHFKEAQAWIGLHPQALQTPYCDLLNVLTKVGISRLDHVIDVGAAYGRVGIVLHSVCPSVRFTGYEIVKQRQVEGNRVYKKLGIVNSQIIHQNVLDGDFRMPDADVYFIYDFSDMDDVYQVLRTLSLKTLSKDFYLITRGDRVGYLMKNKFGHIWKSSIDANSSDLRIYSSISVLKENV